MLGIPLLFSALFAFILFYFFRWVFIERYSAEISHIYAALAGSLCGVITYVTLVRFF